MKFSQFTKFALVAISLAASHCVYAVCRLEQENGTAIGTPLYNSVMLSDFSVPRNKIIGSSQGTYGHGWRDVFTRCDAGATQTTAEIAGGKLVPGYTNVYETGIPGVGIRFRAAIVGVANTQIAPFNVTNNSTGGQNVFNSGIDIIVTGPVGAGTVNGSTLPTMTWRAIQGSARVSYVLRVDGTMTVTSQTCKIKNASISVPMPSVSSKDLKDVGATAGDKKFAIDLQSCTPGIGIHLTLTDVGNPANTSNTLSVDESSGVRGVGYQILNGSTPVNFGPDSAVAGNPGQLSIGQASGENVSIPLTVRYVRTSDRMSSGIASGRASFTMSYQ